jgi:hypothetical protein
MDLPFGYLTFYKKKKQHYILLKILLRYKIEGHILLVHGTNVVLTSKVNAFIVVVLLIVRN